MPTADELLTITEARDGAIAVAGEVDVVTCEVLRERLTAAVGNADTELLVDLSEVGFIDSSGLGVLLEAREASAARQLKLVVRDPSPAVRRLLEITGLTERL